MSAVRLTRRSLLFAAGGALAGGLTRPGGALAALGAEAPLALSDAGSAALRPASARSSWHAAPTSSASNGRSRRARGCSCASSPLTVAGALGGGRRRRQAPITAAPGALIGEPVWTGGTRSLQLRTSHALRGVRLHLVDVSGGMGARRVGLAARRSPLASLGRTRWRWRADPAGRPRSAADHRARARGRGDGAAACGARIRSGAAGVRPPHREPERLLAARGAGDAARDLRLPPLRARLERHRLQLRASTPSGASSRRAPGASTSRSWAPRRAATTSSPPAWPCSAPSPAGRSPPPRARSAAPARVEALAARRAARGRVTVRVEPGRRRLQPLPGQRPRLAAARRRPPRRRHHRLPGRRAVCASCLRSAAACCASPPRPRGRDARAHAARLAARAERSRAPAGVRLQQSSGLAGRLAFLDGTPIAGAQRGRFRRAASRAAASWSSSRRSPKVQTDAAGSWSLPGERRAAAAGVSLRALYAGAAAGARRACRRAGAAVPRRCALAAARSAPRAAPAPTPSAAARSRRVRPVLGLGPHEQRRRARARGPLVAGVVEARRRSRPAARWPA